MILFHTTATHPVRERGDDPGRQLPEDSHIQHERHIIEAQLIDLVR